MLTPAVMRALSELESRVAGLRRTDPGGASLEVMLNRMERPESAGARVIEGHTLQAHVVPNEASPAVTAFLDGVQESREIAWVGVTPLVYGRVAAVVRERRDRRLFTWGDALRRREAIYAPWSRFSQREQALFQEFGLSTRNVTDEENADGTGEHPFRQVQASTNAVKQDREALERDLAASFCVQGSGLLYLDGPLPASEEVLQSDRVAGVIKSHQTVYATGPSLTMVLSLAAGQRSSMFVIESRHRDPVASWYLRLRNASAHGPFWGLVRVEIPLPVAERGGGDIADEWSGRVMAERAPLALPDGRWDTMAYGIRNCEEVLKH
jgi:hypothetical protein